MDPHFNEYLAAIAGLCDLYGDRPDGDGTEFHDADEGGVETAAVETVA